MRKSFPESKEKLDRFTKGPAKGSLEDESSQDSDEANDNAEIDDEEYSEDEVPVRRRGTHARNNNNSSSFRQSQSEESEEAGGEDSESELSLDLDNDEFEDQQQRERSYRRSKSKGGDDDAFSSLRKSDRNKKKNVLYSDQKHSWDETSSSEELLEDLVLPDKVDKSHVTGARIAPVVVKTKVMEKILAHRKKTANRSPLSPMKQTRLEKGAEAMVVDEPDLASMEFLVKWKGRSLLHAEWVSQSVIDSAHMGKSRLARFLNKEQEITDMDEPFDPNFTTIDRILAAGTYEDRTYYLVKWCGLQHADCTWECVDDINDDLQIQKYRARQVRPKKIYLGPVHVPKPDEFEVLKSVPYHTSSNQLRSYQLEGLNWLRYNWYHGINSILADEMGLGKTVQSISIIDYLYRVRKIRGPFLVVVPLSTLTHWLREFERWTELNALLYHGSAQSRETILQHEWYYEDGKGCYDRSGPLKFNVIITTYEMVISDNDLFRKIDWRYVIIDEAHRLKNKSSKLTQELARLRYDRITLLTGTPIQNNIEELWTLLNIINAQQFDSFLEFSDEFGDLKESSKVEKLQKLLRPYLLRRLKEDVETSIAPKEETIIEVELTQLQKKYYRATLEKNFSHLAKGGKSNNVPSLMNVMMQLRKCCNHPFLLQGVEDYELAEKDPSEHMKELIEASGKLVLIDKLLPKLIKDQHKVLIFSQMVRVLDILQDYLYAQKIKHERIDGGVRGNDRQDAIDRFSSDNSDIFVFLLCTRAGGLGINLTAADTVIIYDSDWNPQNDVQAQARCHRIGQEKKVKIYRLITKNTYEQEMFEKASKKLGLDHAVLTQFDTSGTEAGEGVSKVKPKGSEIDALLRNGAYGLFREEDDDASRTFKEADIERILESNTKTVVHASHDGSSTFSKASFSSESSRPELDIRDPDFWRKLMTHQDALQRQPSEILTETRFRKSTSSGALHASGAGNGSEASDEEDDFDDLKDGEDDFQLPEGDGANKFVRPKYPAWTSIGRSKFQKGLLLFGYGRWRQIRKSLSLYKTELVMELYGRAYLGLLCQHLRITVDEAMAQMSNRDPNELEEEDDALFINTNPNASTSDAANGAGQSPAIPSLMLVGRPGLPSNFGVAQYTNLTEKQLTPRTSSNNNFSANSNNSNASGEANGVESEQSVPDLVPVNDEPTGELKLDAPSNAAKSDETSSLLHESSVPQSTPLEASNDAAGEVTQQSSTPPSKPKSPEEMADEEAGYYDNDRSLTDPLFQAKLQKAVKTIFKRLQNLAQLGEFVRSDFAGFNDNTSWPVQSAALTPGCEHLRWWKGKHDKDLLIGVYRHGFGRYNHILRDRTLCFYGNVRSEDKEAGKQKGRKAKPSLGSLSLSSSGALSAIREKEKEKKRGSEEGVEEVEGEATTNINNAATSKSEEKDKESEKESLPAFPSSKWLTSRFKQILHQLSHCVQDPDAYNDQSGKRHGLGHSSHLGHGHGKGRDDKKHMKMKEGWSKRENLDFYRVLMTHGLPAHATKAPELDFEFLKAKARLSQKTVDAIKQHYTKLTDSFSRLDELKADGTLSETLKQFNCTQSQANKVIERIRLFEVLRSHVLPLTDDVLAAKLAPLARESAFAVSRVGLPNWWIPIEHDIAMVRGFDKHGVLKWDLVMNDPALPFRKILMEKAKDAKLLSASAKDASKLNASGSLSNAASNHHQFFQELSQSASRPLTTHMAFEDHMSKLIAPTPQHHEPAMKQHAFQQAEPAAKSALHREVTEVMDEDRKEEVVERMKVEGEAMSGDATNSVDGDTEEPRIVFEIEVKSDQKEKAPRGPKPGAKKTQAKSGKLSASGQAKVAKSPKKGASASQDKEWEKGEYDVDNDLDEKDADTGKKGKRKSNQAKGTNLVSLPRDSVFLVRVNLIVQLVSQEAMRGEGDAGPEKKRRLSGSGPLGTSGWKAIGEDSSLSNVKRKKNLSQADIKRDEKGDPVYPLVLGGVLTIETLGEIVTNDACGNFHNDKYIWPLGFKSTREYISTLDPNVRTRYTCEILQANKQPLFRITPADDAANPVVAKSASQAWTKILERINEKKHAKEKAKRTSVSGPEYFGFGIDVVAELIAKLPNAEMCTKYKWFQKNMKTEPSSNSAAYNLLSNSMSYQMGLMGYKTNSFGDSTGGGASNAMELSSSGGASVARKASGSGALSLSGSSAPSYGQQQPMQARQTYHTQLPAFASFPNYYSHLYPAYYNVQPGVQPPVQHATSAPLEQSPSHAPQSQQQHVAQQQQQPQQPQQQASQAHYQQAYQQQLYSAYYAQMYAHQQHAANAQHAQMSPEAAKHQREQILQQQTQPTQQQQ